MTEKPEPLRLYFSRSAHPQRNLHSSEGRRFFPGFCRTAGTSVRACARKHLEELKKKKILFVAGGVGTAPVYPQVKWLHEHGIDADVIVGAKTKDLVILEDKMSKQ